MLKCKIFKSLILLSKKVSIIIKRSRWKLEKTWFNKTIEETYETLKTDPQKGLSSNQVKEKQEE